MWPKSGNRGSRLLGFDSACKSLSAFDGSSADAEAGIVSGANKQPTKPLRQKINQNAAKHLIWLTENLS